MNTTKFFFIFFATILFSNSLIAQKSTSITLPAVFASGEFYPSYMQGFTSMKDGIHFSELEDGSITIKRYDAPTVAGSTLLKLENPTATDYHFNATETKLLVEYTPKSIYRYSKTATYVIADVVSGKNTPLHTSPVMYPTFSPDSKQVAFVENNNLYSKDIVTNKLTAITTNGKKNSIINGASDWVHEEEFELTQAYQWNVDGSKIAYYQMDETEVPEYNMPLYKNQLYPTLSTFKYPKSGQKNSKISIWVYDFKTKKNTKLLDNTSNNIEYFPRIQWTQNKEELAIVAMNRLQNELSIYKINTVTNQKTTYLQEIAKNYIEITSLFWQFLQDGSCILTSEKDGYNQLYHYDNKGILLKKLTPKTLDITKVYGIDEKNNTVYIQTTNEVMDVKVLLSSGVEANSSQNTNKDIYKIDYKTGNTALVSTKEQGTHNAYFSSTYAYFLQEYSTTTIPPVYSSMDNNGKVIQVLEDNKKFETIAKEYDFTPKELFNLSDGKNNWNAWQILPSDFDKTKKYPLFVTIYGGPGHCEVNNEWDWEIGWRQYLAQQGYIILCIDPRGTGNRGRDFRTVTYGQLGNIESQDLKNAVEEYKKNDFVAKDKITIQGWSYGGYLSSLCLLKYPETFQNAVAVAPVTNWMYYDNIYIERYMGLPKDNAAGYKDNSPINFAKNLKGNYLIIHGTADDNVHIQNTYEMVSALNANNKQFEMFIYPDKNHNLSGGSTRLNVYTRMFNFLQKNNK